MAEKTRIIEIKEKGGAFGSVLRRFTGTKEKTKEYNFSDIALLRKLLSNEKARLLSVVKEKNPESIYALTKLLGRDFKSVRDDIKLLEKFGFIELVAKTKSNRTLHKPVLTATALNIIVRI